MLSSKVENKPSNCTKGRDAATSFTVLFDHGTRSRVDCIRQKVNGLFSHLMCWKQEETAECEDLNEFENIQMISRHLP